MCILLSGILLFALCSPALAQDAATVADPLLRLAHVAITVLGAAVAFKLAFDAFARREVSVANMPTFPKYMSNPQQYRLGSLSFAAFAALFYMLLIYRHKEVAAVSKVFGEGLSKSVIDAVEADAAPYLLVVFAMGAIYLYCLKKEASWNVLLMTRDAIQSWISIPQLADDIVAQIKFSMKVPPGSVGQVLSNSTEVVEQDFHKDRNTPDRIWAETCYLKWWLTQGEGAGEDAIFFTEKSFGFQDLLGEFDEATARMSTWKGGGHIEPLAAAGLVQKIKELHNKFSRVVACYLIYRNASSEALRVQARTFGIELPPAPSQNPLKYWIVYALALVVSVYVGVYASAIAYDLMTGAGLVLEQDSGRVLSWMFYSLSNFGVAIIAILLLRVVSPYLGLGVNQTHLLTYCWTFVVAFLTGPFGLAIAVHLVGPEKYQTMPFLDLFRHTLQWGFAPALVGVYISYYLDRQTCRDLPDINHSYATVGWRLLNCIGFAAITLFLLLPPLLALKAEDGAAWDTSKLRFVSSGTTFFIVFGLALAAQFALRKKTQEASPVLTPRTS